MKSTGKKATTATQKTQSAAPVSQSSKRKTRPKKAPVPKRDDNNCRAGDDPDYGSEDGVRFTVSNMKRKNAPRFEDSSDPDDIMDSEMTHLKKQVQDLRHRMATLENTTKPDVRSSDLPCVQSIQT